LSFQFGAASQELADVPTATASVARSVVVADSSATWPPERDHKKTDMNHDEKGKIRYVGGIR
jgi:hypothetical protein